MPAALLPALAAAVAVAATAAGGSDCGADACLAAGGSTAGPALLQRSWARTSSDTPPASLAQVDVEHASGSFASNGDVLKQLTHDGSRCSGKPASGWGNLGRGVSEESCKQACLDKYGCKYVVFFAKKGACTEFSTCSKFKKQRGKSFTAWQKDTESATDEEGDYTESVSDDEGDYTESVSDDESAVTETSSTSGPTENARDTYMTPERTVAQADNLARSLTTFKFTPGSTEKTLDGRKTFECDLINGKRMHPDDQVGPIGLAMKAWVHRRKGHKFCKKGRMRKSANGMFPVTIGTLDSTNLPEGEKTSYFAFAVEPPRALNPKGKKRKIRTGQQTIVYFKPFKGEADYTIHTWDGLGRSVLPSGSVFFTTDQLRLVQKIDKAETRKENLHDGFVRTAINVGSTEWSTTIVIEASSVGVTAWPQPHPGVEVALVSSTNGVSVTARRYDVHKPGTQHAPTLFDPFLFGERGGRSSSGPSNWFPRFIKVSRDGAKSGGKRHGVVFQDEQERNKIYVTWFGLGDGITAEASLPTTVELKLPDPPADTAAQGDRWWMMGATSDGDSRLWLLVWSNGGLQKQKSRARESDRRIMRFNSQTGAVELVESFNSVDIVTSEFSKGSHVSYRPTATGNGQVGLIMSGGKRHGHQGGVIVVFDGESLKKLKERHSASHSQCNRLTVSADGSKFIATESGDNFPRGLVLHSFDHRSMDSRLVFQVMTNHGGSPGSPDQSKPWKNEEAPEYPGRYKWSNDNNVHHQMTNAIPLESGESLVFLRALTHPSLFARKGGHWGVGCIKVSQDFFKGRDPDYKKKCTDGMCNGYFAKLQPDPKDFVFNDEVPSEQGVFYTFMGSRVPQSNHGVKWVANDTAQRFTQHSHEEMLVSGNIKAVRIGENKNLIMFETRCNQVWGAEKGTKRGDPGKWYCSPTPGKGADKVIHRYRQTKFMTVDDDCTVTREPQEFGYQVRVPFGDDIVVDKEAGTAVVYVGQGRKLLRYDISIA